MKRALPPPLVALTPGDLAPEGIPALLEKVRAAVGAGLTGILVREPELLDRPLLELARKIRRLLPDGGWLGIHDRLHLAAAAEADAVHLGFHSLLPAQARQILPDEIAIGFSAHEGDDSASWRASDYLFFGPVRETPSKQGWKDPVGFVRLATAVRRSPVPVWAIGGLRPEDVEACIGSGCGGLAVRNGILAGAEAGPFCSSYLASLSRAGEGGTGEV